MSITVHENGGFSVTGRESMALYRLIVLRQALDMYAKTGLRPNRHITPTVMLEMAGHETGKKYKRGQHAQAADDLTAVIDAARQA